MRKLITRFCNFIFGKHKNNTLPRVWILAADMVLVIVAYVIASLMRAIDTYPLPNLIINWKLLWLLPSFYLVSFLISRTYDGMLRYAGFNDIRKIFSSCTITLAMLVLSKFFFLKFSPSFATAYYPSFMLMVYHYLITLVMMIIMRFTIRRLYNEVYKNTGDKMNTLIYGAGDGGMMLQRTLSQDKTSKFRIRAFVDDDPKRAGTQINTIKIYTPQQALTPEFIEKYDIDVMIVAIPSLSEERNK